MESDSDRHSDEVAVAMGMGGGGSSNGGSRWNPTKEQINMLESLYKQGTRTPTAEEIQQITARLRVYGHIEGKNVFYWFQNHKARQRQKQKQDTIAYFNRFLHRPHHLFSPPTPFYPNVMCAPYCMAQAESEAVFYPQHHHPKGMVVPVGVRRERVVAMGVNGPAVYDGGMQERISDYRNQETLELFPMHPTGILDGKEAALADNNKVKVMLYSSSSSSAAAAAADTTTSSSAAAGNSQPFFDFFTSGQGGSLESTGGLN